MDVSEVAEKESENAGVNSLGQQARQGQVGKGAGKVGGKGKGKRQPPGSCNNCWKSGHWACECFLLPALQSSHHDASSRGCISTLSNSSDVRALIHMWYFLSCFLP